MATTHIEKRTVNMDRKQPEQLTLPLTGATDAYTADVTPGTRISALSMRIQDSEQVLISLTGDLYRKTNAIIGPLEEGPVEERPQLDEDSPSIYALETSVELLQITITELVNQVSRYTESGI